MKKFNPPMNNRRNINNVVLAGRGGKQPQGGPQRKQINPTVGAPPTPASSNENPKPQKATPEVNRSAILESIKNPPTFAQQMQILVKNLHANRDQIEASREIIYNDLTSALAPMFALNNICFFGSSVTGLDVQGSDLDVYISNVRQRNKPEIATLKIIRTLIFKCRKFCDVLLIAGAKVPIIKCIHTKTQICCDLNIKNKLAVCNSELIKFYLSLDENLLPLMIFIKYWAETCGLKKVSFFSGYALYMLVIFYLQQKPYNLPSVKDLQDNHPQEIVDGWNCAFSTAKDFDNNNLKNATILQLTEGFFAFYAKFDYFNYVVCPFQGKPIDKCAFIKPVQLPPGYRNALTFDPSIGICIQDPFEHARDVSATVPLALSGKFGMLCRKALLILSGNENGMMHKLLAGNIPLKTSNFQINKPLDYVYQKWVDLVKLITLKTLKDVLRFEVNETALSGNMTYRCEATQNIFFDRPKIMKHLSNELPLDIDIETAASDCISRYLNTKFPTKINFVLTVVFSKITKKATFSFMTTSKCKQFPHYAHFLDLKLQKFLETALIPRSDEQNESLTNPLNANSIEKETRESEIGNHGKGMSEDLTGPAPESPESQEEMIKTDIKNIDSDIPEIELFSENSLEFENQVSINHTEDVKCTNAEDKSEPKEEEEEEDIPPDFFDDFANQDFMDGLDIVDAWDGESKSVMERERLDKSEKKHSPIRFGSNERSDKRSRRPGRSRSKSPPRRRNRSSSRTIKPRSKSRSRELRRDPEKTRRDIDRDKIKCAKDKEQKIVSDKLKLVETGLVPPGTEMEADISSILSEKRKSKSRSPRKCKNSGSNDVVRSRDRNLMRKRSSSRSRDSGRDKARKRYSRTPPPYRRNRDRLDTSYRRRRASSGGSNVSERELWIRSSRKRSRSRDLQYEEEKKKIRRKYEEEKKKKKTFLEEIRDKLNEVRPANTVVQYAHIMPTFNNVAPNSAPAPVPAPNPFFPQTPTSGLQQYDQNFFIGDAYPQNQNNFNLVTGRPMVRIPQAAPAAQAQISSDLTANKESVNKFAFDVNKATSDATIDKLFADKKISLSDFLTITAKCEVQQQTSNPDHLQKKIKVISRCQDAIKSMSDDRKFSGRLFVKQLPESKTKSEVKFQSPLRRIPIIRFQFTSPAKPNEDFDSFASALDKILHRVGILKEVIELDDTPSDSVFKLSTSLEEEMALVSKGKALGGDVGCEECKKRKLIQFAEVGSQCADDKKIVDIGVQVNEDELAPANKGLLKNESIAYLTPAQLLNKEKSKEPPLPAPEAPKQLPVQQLEPKKPPPKPLVSFKTRGRGRKPPPTRSFSNSFHDEYEYAGRGRSSYDSRATVDPRFGGPVRFSRQDPMYDYEEEQEMLLRINQFREEELFMEFNQPFIGGRNPPNRFGPRF